MDLKLSRSRNAEHVREPAQARAQRSSATANLSPATEPPAPDRILRLQRLAGNRAVGEMLGKQRPPSVVAHRGRLSVQRIKSAGHGADELSAVRAMKGPKGSVAGGVKPGTSSGAGQGFHKGY